MKILFVVTRRPDPNGSADQFTTFRAIEYLEKNGHEVDDLILSENKIFSLSFIYKCLKGLFKLTPFQVTLFDNKKNKQLVLNKIQKSGPYKKFYIHLIRGMSIKDAIPKEDLYLGMQLSQGLNFARISKELPLGIKKLLYLIEAKLCFFYESNIFDSVRRVNFVGTQDPDFLKLDHKIRSYTVIPHGINLDFEKQSYCERELIFLANFSSEANKSAFYLLRDSIMTRVWEKDPDIKLTICGKNIPKQFYANPTKNILIRGEVEEPLSVISSHKIFLNPVRAAVGMQNKVLAGMAAGLPVITFESAVAGMKLDYETCFVTDSSSSKFANLICTVLKNYPSQEKLDRVRMEVRDIWSWDALHKKWSADFLELK